MQIYFHSCLCSYLSRVPILVEDTVYICIYIYIYIYIYIIKLFKKQSLNLQLNKVFGIFTFPGLSLEQWGTRMCAHIQRERARVLHTHTVCKQWQEADVIPAKFHYCTKSQKRSTLVCYSPLCIVTWGRKLVVVN